MTIVGNWGDTTLATHGCRYCGAFAHTGICPLIERISYYPDGSVKDVWVRRPWIEGTPVAPSKDAFGTDA